ncbi:MAG TPA: 2Fe-2S iron-sulfur cluster-binding protein, partial [Geminicoccaceae bacterium]
MADDALVVFTPSGRRGRFPRGTNLLQAARTLGVDLDSVCGGRAICGRCQVEIADGAFAKHGIRSSAGHVTPAGAAELRYGARKPLQAGRRLGCQACIEADLVVDVPADSQVHRQVVRKRAEVRDIALDPVVRLHYVEVEPPRLERPEGDLQRLCRALREQWSLDRIGADLRTIQCLQAALRDGGYKVTVAVHEGRRMIAIWPGFHDRAFGIAIDVGSTTIAAHLADLQTGEVLASGGTMNPQIRFGEDLMSRVSYVMMNPGGDREMTRAVRVAIDALITQVVQDAGVAGEEVLELTLVGNPIMHHLVLGIDPTEL